jgi:quinol monooxygenase YgiN
MNSDNRKLARSFALIYSFVLTLGGCTIATSFPNTKQLSTRNGKSTVVLVLTKIEIDTKQRKAFDQHTRRVIRHMSKQPGLLGFSARRELIGPNGWTISIWKDDASRAQFMRTAVHREAIKASLPAIIRVTSKRIDVAPQELPKNWREAIALMDQPDGIRNFVH